ncbi:hypothetical protein J2Y46_002619 [Microbacterium sp. BE35]|uniref:phage tail fiber protein n=1 Tax=Microbacterium sp. BE35 TaxID=2817773 RepID=UPI00285BA8F4|nr:hypothetical protein [Microbacterium sp. BE35]MDR7189793.1 hypothetical protein [Microbacterium sp. BE35]
MAGGWTQAQQQAVLDLRFPTTGGTSYIAYSANGTTETGNLARTAIGATGWAAATAATPSVKANANALTSAGASGAVTVTHVALFDASTSGNQITDWTALGASRVLATSDVISWAVGSVAFTLD